MNVRILPAIILLSVWIVAGYAQDADTLEASGQRESKFFGDYYIPAGEKSDENIRVFGGDLFVAGEVDGEIIVLGGDVFLESTAVVNGRIVAIGGTVSRKHGAVVKGRVVEANIREGISYSEGTPREKQRSHGESESGESTRPLLEPWTYRDAYWFVYNRNEGFRFTPINWHMDRRGESSLRLGLTLGYRFGQRQVAGRLSLEKSVGLGFFPPGTSSLVAFASALRESRTDDDYRIPEKENSLAAFLARQDFLDRWDEEGYEAGLTVIHPAFRLKTAYRNTGVDPFSVTRRQVRIFQKDRQFRPTLDAIQDNIRSILTTLGVRTHASGQLISGLNMEITTEIILDADSIDTFNRWRAGVTASWKMVADILLRSRVLVGSAQGTLPDYRSFGVGGLGSVSAYPHKLQTGDRMLQLNVELIFLPEFIGKGWLVSLFSDMGHAWKHRDYGFSDFNAILESGISAIGLGVGDDDLDWRVNFARPLDGRKILETTFRLNLNF